MMLDIATVPWMLFNSKEVKLAAGVMMCLKETHEVRRFEFRRLIVTENPSKLREQAEIRQLDTNTAMMMMTQQRHGDINI